MKIPSPIWARAIACTPYAWRYPGSYWPTQRLIRSFDQLELERQRDWIFKHVRAMTRYAFEQIPFYSRLYREQGFDPVALQGFDDLTAIPIVTKDLLRSAPLTERSRTMRGGAKAANTGGTSGSPLAFYVEPGSNGREWAYIHTIWRKLGFDFRDDRCTFRGANLGEQAGRYDPRENQFIINTYRPPAEQADAVLAIARTHTIRYLHGYPSAISFFARACMSGNHPVRDVLKKNLRGVFLGSEYPAPMYRTVIEDAFGAPTISWYGHSERAVLAQEDGEPYLYHPFQSYGWTEAVADPASGGDARLIGTSYWNHAAPLIRYDTGDTVAPQEQTNGILRSFRVSKGRIGDVILDRHRQPISLTALVFGRHHPLFDHVESIQISQEIPGHATVIVAAGPRTNTSNRNWALMFDGSGVDMHFDFVVVDTPVRTARGKTPLLVPPEEWKKHPEANS